MTSFALIGAAGYVAPRHMKAIKDTGNRIVAAADPSDSVGILDSYDPAVRYFPEIERFDRHLEKLRRGQEEDRVHYVSICSPNYLHDAHVRFALRSDADAICEKPLALNPWNIDGLAEIEQSTGRKVNTILQLRLHPSIIALKEKIAASGDRMHEVDLTYITSRGRWYYVSWKGDEHKSGGIATNIGVHFYDMLTFVFGPLKENHVHRREVDCASGYLEYEKARVRWFLSINRNDLPQNVPSGQTTFRSITIDGEELEFSGGFTDLHTQSYQQIVAGDGFTLEDVRPSVEAVSYIRTANVDASKGEQHPFLSGALDKSRYRNGFPA